MRTFISDCEGPISKNDNAFEVASHFLPKGDYLFSLISRYDDVLADVIKRPGYVAGTTLALITPFLKAHGVTNKDVEEFSAQNIILIRGADVMLRRVHGILPSFIVSTSYEQYIASLCTLLDFPCENVYCTKLNLDKYTVDEKEGEKLKQLEKEISTLPMIEVPRDAQSISELPPGSQAVVKQLNGIFWDEIPRMTVGKMLEEIKPLGGEEKANAVRDIAERVNCSLDEAMYVGDSITDVQAFQLVRQGGGLTISFNGNEYAVRNAEVAVLSDRAVITMVFADVFAQLGRAGALKLVEEWSSNALRRYCSDETLVQEVLNAYDGSLPNVELVTEDSVDRLVEKSSSFRKTVRGEAIGKLG